MRLITSVQNRAIREARKLKQGKYRQQQQRFLIEGTRLVGAALRGNARVSEAFVTRELVEGPQGAELLSALESRRAELMLIPDEALREVADTENPQGIVAVVESVVVPLMDLKTRHTPLLLVLDGVADPGNVGTLIRTAWSQGTHAVILGENCCDPLNPKAVRATMGGLFHVPVAISGAAEETARFLKSRDITLVGSATGEGVVCDRFNFPKAVAIAIGSEVRGLSPAMRDAAAALVTIPEQRGAESLNAAAAGAVLLYEAMRQRRVNRAQSTGRARPSTKRPPHERPQKGRATGQPKGRPKS